MAGTTTTPALTVDRFLDAVCAGVGVPSDLFAPDAVLDATVPGWRFAVRHAGAMARQYSSWFAHPRIFEEFERLPFGSGGRWDAGRLAEMGAADHAG